MKEKKIADYRESHTLKGKGKVYDNSFEIFPFRKFSWEWEKKQLDIILAKHLKPEHTVLDFACGTGRILDYLVTKSKNVSGVDLSDTMLEVSKSRLPDIELVKADITRNNVFEKGGRTFNVITAFRFFLNAQDELRKEVYESLSPILDKDGILIFNNHGNRYNAGVLLSYWFILKNVFRKAENRIYNYHTLSHRDIKRYLKEFNYEIIETYHRGVLPVMNEKTSFDVSKLDGIEDWFSRYKFFRLFARNVLYVCKKN